MRFKTQNTWISIFICSVILLCACPSLTQINEAMPHETQSCSHHAQHIPTDQPTTCDTCPNQSIKITDVHPLHINFTPISELNAIITPKIFKKIAITQSFIIERPPPLKNIKLSC